MQWSDINFRPTSRTLRWFAGLWLLFFGALACWQGLVRENAPLAWAAALLAVAGGAIGLIAPALLRPVYVGWMVLAFPLGWTISKLVVAVIFYGLFTPIGLLFRLFGRDALRLRRPDAVETYWLPRPAVTDPRRYFQQF